MWSSARETVRRVWDLQSGWMAYNANQEEHRMFLTKYGIDFDERYVWD